MKRFILISFILPLLCGCAGMETAPHSDGTVTGNIFQLSGIPGVRIKLDQPFRYVGATSNYVHGTGNLERATSLMSGDSYRQDFYVFVQSELSPISKIGQSQ